MASQENDIAELKAMMASLSATVSSLVTGATTSGSKPPQNTGGFESALNGEELQKVSETLLSNSDRDLFTNVLNPSEVTSLAATLAQTEIDAFSVENTRKILIACAKKNNRNIREDMIYICCLVLQRGYNIVNIISRSKSQAIPTLTALKNCYGIQARTGGNKNTITLARIVTCCLYMYFSIAAKATDKINANFGFDFVTKIYYLNNAIAMTPKKSIGKFYEEICIEIQLRMTESIIQSMKDNNRTGPSTMNIESVPQFQRSARDQSTVSFTQRVDILLQFGLITKFALSGPFSSYDPVSGKVSGNDDDAIYIASPTHSGNFFCATTVENTVYAMTARMFKDAQQVLHEAVLIPMINRLFIFLNPSTGKFEATNKLDL